MADIEIKLPEALQRAMTFHRAGNLVEAERLYRQICAVDPRNVDSLHYLGVLAGQVGRNDIATDLIGRALALKPDYAEAHYNLGNVLAADNRPEQAAAHYKQVLALKPDSAEAHYSLGNLLTRQNRLDQATTHYKRVLALKPNFAEAHNCLGTLLSDQGKPTEAMACFDRALAIRPDFAEALYHQGTVLTRMNRLDDAVTRYQRALALKPDFAEAHHNLANLLTKQNRLDQAAAHYKRALALKPDFATAHNGLGAVLMVQGKPTEAMACFERALALKPDLADALFNCGNALRDLKGPAEALASYDKALAVKPDHSEALNNRGFALLDLKRPAEALASFDKALTNRPDYADALNNRGLALRDLRRPAEALASFDRALAIEPDHRYAFGGLAEAALAICDWARSERLAAELEVHVAQRRSIISPFTSLGYGVGPSLQLECARMFIEDKLPAPAQPLWNGAVCRHEKLRVAYLSADFYRHATAFLTAELFELHDRARFEILGISFGPDDQSEIRSRLVRAFDRFHDVRTMGDLEVAKLLNDLQVDIAIDLKGHTQDARSRILAHRPAPIQVSYLGYPGTMGADFIDYVIADKTVLPFDQQPFHTEKIVHLPDCYQVNDSKREIAARTPTRRESGLPDEGFVFCCFNNNYKITRPVFDVWMRLLGAVEGSVLWLLQSNSDAHENLRREAAARGIDSARMVFAEGLKLEEHLARQRLADLFVDTLPVNAHTTASDALWAGLPLLTCRGASFVGRVATSLLYAVGLPELVTRDLGEYEALALRLATDASLLRGFRHRLEQNRATCALFDTDRFRRHIESAYSTMWDIQRRGESPRSFSV